jgi:acetyltransferase-like isoleucine patch superfamily enzyme
VNFISNYFSGKLFVSKLLPKLQNKSFSQLIETAITRTLDTLILLKYRLQYPHVQFGYGVRIRGKFLIKGKGKVTIGNHCVFVSFGYQLNQIVAQDPSATVTIGNSCFFNATTLSIEGKGQIEIGDHAYFNGPFITATHSSITFKKECLVSDARIVDTDFHSIEINRRNPDVKSKNKPVSVGENVWIGSRSMILKGVTIGNNSVIGAMTVVRQSVPDNVVVIGNPQQIVKQLDTAILPYEFPSPNITTQEMQAN